MLLAVPDSVDVPALIRSRLPELSPNDRRIAAWLLEHEAEAPFQTAESLARGAGVSKAAVVRFGSRLGFGGYAGLSEAMAGAASQRLARQGGAGRAAPHGHLLDRWLSACLGDLEATRSAISDDLLDAVATLLLAGDGRTYVFGQRKSASLAEYAFFLLSPLVPNVQLIASGTASLADLLLDVHAGDRLLVLTFRPYARMAGEVIEFFRQAGGSIVLDQRRRARPERAPGRSRAAVRARQPRAVRERRGRACSWSRRSPQPSPSASRTRAGRQPRAPSGAASGPTASRGSTSDVSCSSRLRRPAPTIMVSTSTVSSPAIAEAPRAVSRSSSSAASRAAAAARRSAAR